MSEGSTNGGASNDLEARLAQLEMKADQGQVELRTRRLVVVDEHDQPRMVGEVGRGGVVELRLDARSSTGNESASVAIFASPGDDKLDLRGGCGLQVWIDGNSIDEFTVWAERVE